MKRNTLCLSLLKCAVLIYLIVPWSAHADVTCPPGDTELVDSTAGLCPNAADQDFQIMTVNTLVCDRIPDPSSTPNTAPSVSQAFNGEGITLFSTALVGFEVEKSVEYGLIGSVCKTCLKKIVWIFCRLRKPVECAVDVIAALQKAIQTLIGEIAALQKLLNDLHAISRGLSDKLAAFYAKYGHGPYSSATVRSELDGIMHQIRANSMDIISTETMIQNKASQLSATQAALAAEKAKCLPR